MLHATLHATVPTSDALHATPEDDGDDDEAEVIVDGEAMPLGKAKALKETYLARLRRLEFEVKSGRLVDAEFACSGDLGRLQASG